MTIENKNGYFKIRKYELIFEDMDANRVVPTDVTGYLMYNLHIYLESYREKIIPSIMGSELSTEKHDKLCEYIDQLELIRDRLIPENQEMAFLGGHYCVEENYSFLKPNKVLTHNQALFTLLGLNTKELDDSLSELPTLNGIMPKGDHTILEGILWQTSRNFELRSCAYFDNGKITSENLIKFATEDNNFFSVNWKGNKHLQEAKDVSKLPKNEREATKAKRAMVEALVQECKSIEKHQRWNKGAIASWVSEKLLEQYEINLSENAISRHYMNK